MKRYEITAINGSLEQYTENPCIESLSYHSLLWEETEILCKLSVDQGFQCIVKEQPESKDGKKVI